MAATELSTLITALRVETEKNSISPENIGYLIQLVYEYANSHYSSLQNSLLENTQISEKISTTLSSLLVKFEEVVSGCSDVGVELDNTNNKVNLLLKDKEGNTKHTMTIPAATVNSIGLMTAQDKKNLDALNSHQLFEVVGATAEGLPDVDNDLRRSDVIYLVYQGGDDANNVLNEYVWVEVTNELTGSKQYQWGLIGRFNVKELYQMASIGELIGGTGQEAPYVGGSVEVEGDGIETPWKVKVDLSYLASILYYLDNQILGNDPIQNGLFLEYRMNHNSLQNHLDVIAKEVTKKHIISMAGESEDLSYETASREAINLYVDNYDTEFPQVDLWIQYHGTLYQCYSGNHKDDGSIYLYAQNFGNNVIRDVYGFTFKDNILSYDKKIGGITDDEKSFLNGAGTFTLPIIYYELPHKGTITLTQYYNLRYWGNTPICVKFTYLNGAGFPLVGYVTQVQVLDTGIIIKAISYQKQSESVVKLVEVTCSINPAGYVEWSTEELFNYKYEDNTINNLSNQRAYTENVSDIYTPFNEEVPTAFVDTMKASGTNEKVQMLYDPLYKTIQMRTSIGDEWSNWEVINKKEVYIFDCDALGIADEALINSTLLKELHKNYFGGVACFFKISGILQPIKYQYSGGETMIDSYTFGEQESISLRFSGDASLFADDKDIEVRYSNSHHSIITSDMIITNDKIDALFE
ncbi:MAG: hypothetical protein E7080_09765 [Bacteroidales bacterium]|nr:hypothetical protein [Bacteroidales bacterium]